MISGAVAHRIACLCCVLWVVCAFTSCSRGDGDNNVDNAAPNNETTPMGFRLIESTPTNNASSVPPSAELRLVFSDAIDPESLQGATSINPLVPGTARLDEADAKVLLFKPDGKFAASTPYKFTVSTALTNTDGVQLEDEVSVRFSTASGEVADATGTYEAGDDSVRVSSGGEPGVRTFTMTTTANLRDNDPPEKMISFEEQAGQPYTHSGSAVFDALFAMSVEEARQNSVSSISDGAFNNGQGVPCDCFETGAKWNYVWTRDTAYAVDLGLAILDPTRARNSLEFKLSDRKSGGGIQIIQDTGTGGSWPVSSDRVVWAIGAWELLKYLQGSEREAFRDLAYEAMVNTIAQDRAVVYSPEDGLYRGEQSFLDWREQSYPSWTAQDTVHIAMSRTLSTNVGHHAILTVASKLAMEKGEMAAAAEYAEWASQLSAAIDREFFLEDAGAYSAILTTELDPSPTHKFDLLGNSLLVLNDAAGDASRRREIVSNYPRVPFGPPVLWPQQPLIPIYHNRGIWPFVTAYDLLAAREVDQAAVFEHDLASLVRGAALNLSNMENFEFTALAPWYDDGQYSGPVVNSRRQLWSVAGYFGAIVKGVFGMEATQQGVRFAPYVTADIHAEWFANAPENVATLERISWRGKHFTVKVELPEQPAAPGSGAYSIDAVTLNGQPVDASDYWGEGDLQESNEVVVSLGSATAADGFNLVEDLSDFRELWSPKDPNLTDAVLDGDRVRLTFDGSGEEEVTFNILRDGEQVASGVTGTSWEDTNISASERAHCYAIEAVFSSSGNRSHHSKPLCVWGDNFERVREISVFGFEQVEGGTWSTMHGRAHYQDWGMPSHELAVAYFRPDFDGVHYLQLVYGNGAGGFTTGITSAVKEIVIERASDGEEVARTFAVMPQLADWARWGESSLARVELESSQTYRVRIVDGINMSYFSHFIPYTGGLGGGEGTYNMVNLHALRVLARDGARSGRQGAPRGLSGDEDLGKYGDGEKMAPGAASQPWSLYGVAYDEQAIYISLASDAFEDPYKPLMMYFEPIGSNPPPPLPSQGVAYSDLTPALPFSARFAVSLRRLSDDGSGEGPYNGIWRREDASGPWIRQQRLEQGKQWWISSDQHTLSVRIPREALGASSGLRFVAHVVNATAGNEWRETLPPGHTPWEGGGQFFSVDLSGAQLEDWPVVP